MKREKRSYHGEEGEEGEEKRHRWKGEGERPREPVREKMNLDVDSRNERGILTAE